MYIICKNFMDVCFWKSAGGRVDSRDGDEEKTWAAMPSKFLRSSGWQAVEDSRK